MFIKRNQEGQITAVSTEELTEFNGLQKDEKDEVQDFVKAKVLANSLSQSDADFIRVLDDLLKVLIDKRIIQFTDLPAPAQRKLLGRESLREKVNSLNLIGLDDESIHL